MILLNDFFSQTILSEIMQSLSLGLITVTIAVAIFLAEKGTVLAFDRIVILKKVIQGKTFFIFFLVLFIPLFLWDLGGEAVRSFLFTSYIAGVVGFLLFLFRSYKWIKEIETEEQRIYEGYRQKKRLEYLEEISVDPERLLSWEYIWQLKNKSSREERIYVEKFIQNINSFLGRDNEKDAVDYLSSFEKFINNITLRDWKIFEDIFKALLEWHHKACSSYRTNEENKRRYIPLLIILERLIGNFIEKGLKLGASYIVFETFKNFVTEKISEEEYIKRLIATFAHIFFEHIPDSPESHTIWSDYFPQEWKVTKATIKDRQNLMSKLWLDHFLQWAQQRIWEHYNKDAEWDKQLDDVSKGLFPSIDPIAWAIILTFLMRPWNSGKRMKDLVEIPRRFGLERFGPVLRMSVISYDDSENVQQRIFEELNRRISEQRNNAIELALIIFKNVFSKEKLREYIRELERLSYEKESPEEKYREQIKKIFEDMLNRLNEAQNENGN